MIPTFHNCRNPGAISRIAWMISIFPQSLGHLEWSTPQVCPYQFGRFHVVVNYAHWLNIKLPINEIKHKYDDV